jgi:hypothetical protein
MVKNKMIVGVSIAALITVLMVKSKTSTVSVSGVASISISPLNAQIDIGQSVTFTGTAYDSNNNPIPNVTLYAFINNSLLTSFQTDSNGNYSFNAQFNSVGTFYVDVSDNKSNQ